MPKEEDSKPDKDKQIDPVPVEDKELKHDDKGNFDDLRIETVDPSNIITDEFIKKADGTDSKVPNPRFGKPEFLSWTLKKDEQGEEYWEATGKDNKIYQIVSDEVKPPKKGKVVIIENG